MLNVIMCVKNVWYVYNYDLVLILKLINILLNLCEGARRFVERHMPLKKIIWSRTWFISGLRWLINSTAMLVKAFLRLIASQIRNMDNNNFIRVK